MLRRFEDARVVTLDEENPRAEAVLTAGERIVEVGDRAQVLKLNVQDGIELPIMREYNAFSTPTFIVLNDLGQEVWRQTGSILDKGQALEALELS